MGEIIGVLALAWIGWVVYTAVSDDVPPPTLLELTKKERDLLTRNPGRTVIVSYFSATGPYSFGARISVPHKEEIPVEEAERRVLELRKLKTVAWVRIEVI
jgi:hypothetical protein